MFLLHHHSNTHAVHLLFTHNPGQDDQATHTHTFNGPFSTTTWVSRNQKSKTSLDFTEATDSEWQWHQLGHMQVCISLQTDNHASTPPLSFLQVGCPCCCPTNSVKALKAPCVMQPFIKIVRPLVVLCSVLLMAPLIGHCSSSFVCVKKNLKTY